MFQTTNQDCIEIAEIILRFYVGLWGIISLVVSRWSESVL